MAMHPLLVSIWFSTRLTLAQFSFNTTIYYVQFPISLDATITTRPTICYFSQHLSCTWFCFTPLKNTLYSICHVPFNSYFASRSVLVFFCHHLLVSGWNRREQPFQGIPAINCRIIYDYMMLAMRMVFDYFLNLILHFYKVEMRCQQAKFTKFSLLRVLVGSSIRSRNGCFYFMLIIYSINYIQSPHRPSDF